jgi:hypothetical protein
MRVERFLWLWCQTARPIKRPTKNVMRASPYEARKIPTMALLMSFHASPNVSPSNPPVSGKKIIIIKRTVKGPPNMTCHENTCGDPNPKSM